MNNKKWAKTFLFISLIFFILLGMVNYIVDPLQQYRKATFYQFWYGGVENERFVNAGLAKNYSYNSVVIGSSMIENFLIKDLERLIPNPIKFCMSGATAYEIHTTLMTAFKYKKIQNVIIGLDLYSLKGKVTKQKENMNFPLYLYDKNPINDMNYLFSFDILQKSWKAINEIKVGADTILYDYNHMYEWQYLHNDNFGKAKVLKRWNKRDKVFIQEDWRFSKLRKSFDYNILSIIKKHPETKFYIFYPPYSNLAYFEWEEKDVVNDVLQTKEYIYETLKKYPNVELYDFQVATNITSNLDNYKDSQHYHQKINSWMIEQMLNKNFLVQNNNIENYIDILKQEIEYTRGIVNALQ